MCIHIRMRLSHVNMYRFSGMSRLASDPRLVPPRLAKSLHVDVNLWRLGSPEPGSGRWFKIIVLLQAIAIFWMCNLRCNIYNILCIYYIYTYMYTYIYVCIYIYIHVYTVYIYICTYIHARYMYTYTRILMSIYVYMICTLMCIQEERHHVALNVIVLSIGGISMVVT